MKDSDYDKERNNSFLHRIEEVSKLSKHAAFIAGNIDLESRLINELIELCVNLKNDRVVAKMPRPLM